MTAPTSPPPRQTTNEEKREILEAMLTTGANVYIGLDARRDGVEVPAHLRKHANLVLVIGYNLPTPIPDLDLGPDGIDMALLFSGVREPVFVPWEALYAAQAPAGYAVWADSVPPELLAAAAPAASAPTPSGAVVIDLMSRRTPKDQRAVAARLAKVTAPGPRGGSAA